MLEYTRHGNTILKDLKNKVVAITNNLDKMYMDKLSGILAEADFERIYSRLKEERYVLEIQDSEIPKTTKIGDIDYSHY